MVLTLNGSFTLYNTANSLLSNNNLTGRTVLNACVEQLTTSDSLLRSDTLQGSDSLSQPFWSTEFPLIFAISLTVTLAYVLFLVSFMAHSKRPWLQRAAALSAVVSLTLAADLMFQVLGAQHSEGTYNNSAQLRNVRANTALKVLKVISNTLMWLAQVQVLIRIFPRHRDKIVIKWTGLGLIVLETVFEVLNDFVHPSPVNPNSSNSLIPAIPVLAYLFHIALGVLYAICVLFYTVSNGRWRHAYKFKNWILAIASITCICCPVVFFCLDIWNAQVDGWGDYVRWVSSVAASVIVWDWVDQIEKLIEKDSKTGVLGREVFEDEMHDGRKLKSTEPRQAATKQRLKTKWRRRATGNADYSDADNGLELPVIHHPLATSPASASMATSIKSHSVPQTKPAAAPSNTSQVSGTTRSAYTQRSSVELRRDLRVEHANQYTNESSIWDGSTRISSRREQTAPVMHTSQSNLENPVHPGFTAGDYWQDEKSPVKPNPGTISSSRSSLDEANHNIS